MPGGLLQLNALGDENNYLNGKPKISFFKSIYMRHTNFVKNTIQVNSNISEKLKLNESTFIKIKIPRNADLISQTFLKLNLPDIYSSREQGFKFIENIGEMIIKSVKLYIENQLIEELTGEYIYIYNNLYNTHDKNNIVNNISGNTSELNNPIGNIDNNYRGSTNTSTYSKDGETWIDKDFENKPTINGKTLYIPLPFWYTRFNGLSLPIIALKYHTVYIEIELRPLKDLVLISKKEVITLNKSINTNDEDLVSESEMTRYYDCKPDNTFNIDNHLNGNQWNLNPCLDISYIFLDNTERNELVKRNNQFLIEQVQYRKVNNITGQKNVQIELFHPIKELYIHARRNDMSEINQWNNFTNKDYKSQSLYDFQTHYLELCSKQSNGNIIQNLGSFRTDGSYTNIKIPNTWNGVSENLDIPGRKAYSEDDIQKLLDIWKYRNHNNIPSINKSNFKFYDENIIENMSILINNNERLEKKDIEYYALVENFSYHNNSNIEGLLNYSFSKNPEIFQPTGICNFSEIENITFKIKMKEPVVYGENYKYDLDFYFVNYNILDIRHGMGGLVYGNK